MKNGLPRLRWTEFAVEAFIRVLGFSSIGFVVLIFLFLLREGVPTFFEVPLNNLFSTRWYPTFDLFGTLPLILGSILVTVAAIVMAVPLGVEADDRGAGRYPLGGVGLFRDDADRPPHA
jgi:ABC-type phosphate transport system permease subunit